jgi:hypothetical protein
MMQAVDSAVLRSGLADVEAQALWMRGRSLLGQRKAAAALEPLSQAINLMEPVIDRAVSVQFGRMLGSLALAKFRIGDVASARATYRRVKGINAHHPTLGRGLREEFAEIGKELGVMP